MIALVPIKITTIIRFIKPATNNLIDNLLNLVNAIIADRAKGKTIFSVMNASRVSSELSKPSKDKNINTPAIIATSMPRIINETPIKENIL